jgi:hypothetical protein
LNRQFSKEKTQIMNRYVNKCSTPLAIKDIQIKTTLRVYVALVRTANIKKTDNKCWHLLVGMKVGPATTEISKEVPQEIENRTTI